MKVQGWLCTALVAGGVIYGARGGCLDEQTAPDQELATHFAALCEIARDHVSAPAKGVRKLGRYLGKHTGDMFGDFGDTLAIIERIDHDKKHDERARVARDRIRKPLLACERDWQRFGEAVEADPEANALVEQFARRLNRTFEIIFSSTGTRDLRELPARLRARFEPPAT